MCVGWKIGDFLEILQISGGFNHLRCGYFRHMRNRPEWCPVDYVLGRGRLLHR